MIYCDTAYLAKYYLLEPGSAEVRSLIEEDGEVACCALGKVEVASVFHCKKRESSLSSEDATAIFRQFEVDCRHKIWLWLPLTDDLVQATAQEYQTLSSNIFLRASDALHLACARDNGFKEIYSNDMRLLAAAPVFGLKGKNVIS
ncbi:MAG: type II toxin-antitoxin system VapC family toxin [Verrucomicrobiae bacterium]|nr:type II toxin-antitoxin system VapC family toxin [Verrucomicrobiae bacterium]